MERIMLNICIVLNDTHYCVKQHLQNLLMVVSIYNVINAEFVKFKNPILSQLKGSPLIKTREKIWDSVKEIFAVILQPMISVVSNNLASNLIRKEKDSDSSHVDDSLWQCWHLASQTGQKNLWPRPNV